MQPATLPHFINKPKLHLVEQHRVLKQLIPSTPPSDFRDVTNRQGIRRAAKTRRVLRLVGELIKEAGAFVHENDHLFAGVPFVAFVCWLMVVFTH